MRRALINVLLATSVVSFLLAGVVGTQQQTESADTRGVGGIVSAALAGPYDDALNDVGVLLSTGRSLLMPGSSVSAKTYDQLEELADSPDGESRAEISSVAESLSSLADFRDRPTENQANNPEDEQESTLEDGEDQPPLDAEELRLLIVDTEALQVDLNAKLDRRMDFVFAAWGLANASLLLLAMATASESIRAGRGLGRFLFVLAALFAGPSLLFVALRPFVSQSTHADSWGFWVASSFLSAYSVGKAVSLYRLTDDWGDDVGIRAGSRDTSLPEHDEEPVLLPFQENALTTLRSRVMSELERDPPPNIRLEGPSGSGKTQILRKYCRDPLAHELEGLTFDSERIRPQPKCVYFDLWNHEAEPDLYRAIVLRILALEDNLRGFRWLAIPTPLILNITGAVRRLVLRMRKPDVELEIEVPRLTGQRHLLRAVRRLRRDGLVVVPVFDELDRANDITAQRLVSLIQRGFDLSGLPTVLAYVPDETEVGIIAPDRVKVPDIEAMVMTQHWLAYRRSKGNPTQTTDAEAPVYDASAAEHLTDPGTSSPSLHRVIARMNELDGAFTVQGEEGLRNRLFGDPVVMNRATFSDVATIIIRERATRCRHLAGPIGADGHTPLLLDRWRKLGQSDIFVDVPVENIRNVLSDFEALMASVQPERINSLFVPDELDVAWPSRDEPTTVNILVSQSMVLQYLWIHLALIRFREVS